MGAIKRLEEDGITPDAIVGSSIGVINACLYASGGVENMERAWLDFPSIARVLRPSLRHNLLTGLSASMEFPRPLGRALHRFSRSCRLRSSFFILLNPRGEGGLF